MLFVGSFVNPQKEMNKQRLLMTVMVVFMDHMVSSVLPHGRHPATCGSTQLHLHHFVQSNLPRARLDTLTIGPVSVTFPSNLGNVSLVEGATLQVSLRSLPGAPPVASPVVTVTLSDPSTTAELPVADLPYPITIAFPALQPPPRGLVADLWRCAYASGRGWATDGVWLTGDAEGVRCHTTHLSTFAVLPAVRVTRVQVCEPPEQAGRRRRRRRRR